ncbi:MAG: type I-U CRISPR-associated protein Cas5/Cas6 [Phycisphaerae bacterium]|nr:MAG: type I-U CRISPR-associated protein Cas5/Cas6 [Phycisphaerae bacterium]
MRTNLCISIRFIHPEPRFHGRGDGEQPEWPPSPMRVLQALLNAACSRARGKPLAPELRNSLHVLELIRPSIVAPRATLSDVGFKTYVPHNHADLVAAKWYRDNSSASIAEHRTEKNYRPYRIETIGNDLPTLHYLYPLKDLQVNPNSLLETILPSVRSIYSLGWGIDQVIADATLIDQQSASQLLGQRFIPTTRGGIRLRAPRQDSIKALERRYERFLARLQGNQWTSPPPLTATAFDVVTYSDTERPQSRPYAIFKLVDENEDTVSYPQAKLIHIAGMVKHLAIELMKKYPPRDLRGNSHEQWVKQYVAGHFTDNRDPDAPPHPRFSYVPLPSIGHRHTNPAVRRVMIIAPMGDEDWLEYLAQRLNGEILRPDPKYPDVRLPHPTLLQRIPSRKKDGVRDAYIRESYEWASVTPIILNRHVDKIKKTLPDGKVIEVLDRIEITEQIRISLAQSGIEQPCEFEWGAFSYFPKMLSAHKYQRDSNDPSKRVEIGYLRPDHLVGRTAVHINIRFGRRENPNDPNSRWIPADYPVPGPITIGAGRHCGLGLLARVDPSSKLSME